MASVGEQLRRARVNHELDLEALSARTKISPKFLQAIEEDDRQALPAGFFYRSWVQQYADALGLDVPAILSEVDSILSADQPPALPGRPALSVKDIKPSSLPVGGGTGNRWLQSVVLLVIVVFTCSGVYAWWHKSERAQAGSPVEPDGHEGRVPAGLAKAAPKPILEAKAVKPVEPNTAADTVGTPAATPEPATDEILVEVAATEPTWVSLAPDGRQSYAGVLSPSESKTISAKETAKIRVGNAGGLQVRVNGKPLGSIGPDGQVRTVVVNKSGFQILEPKPVVAGDQSPQQF